MSGLVIESLRIAHAGIIEEPLDLGQFSDGITLITGPNETGKSTVVEMVRAALFERYSAKHAGLRALQPHGTKLAPEVWLDFRLATTKYSLHKRFLERPVAELKVTPAGQASQQFVGADADAEVWSVLKAEPPGRSGARTSDMGAWGLLWVTQDEAAFSDPAATLGSEARVALQDAIGRQVSQVLGGRDGERIRNRLQQEYNRYWTQAQQRPTGQLAEAEAAVEQAQQRIHSIEAALNAVATQAQDYEDWVARAQALKSQRPALVAEVRQAEAEAERLDALTAALALAQAHNEGAQEKLQTAERAVQARSAQVEDLEHRQGVARDLAEEAEALKTNAQARAQALAVAQAALSQTEQALSEAKEQAKQCSVSWQQARQASARHEAQRVLQAAEELQARTQATQQALQRALADEDYAVLNRRQAEVQAAHTALLHTGTRLQVQAGADSERVYCAGRSTKWQIEGLGEVSLRPGQQGLAEARAQRDALHQTVQASLLGLGVPSVAEAQQARRSRAGHETELAQAQSELQRVAAEGLQVLLQERRDAKAEVQRLQRACEEVQRLTKEVQVQQEVRSAHPVSEAQLEEAERLAGAVQQLRAARTAAATRVTIKMQDDLPVLSSAQRCAPDPDGAVRLTITQDTQLRLGELAEVLVEPGGEGLAALQARSERTEAELKACLEALGVQQLGQAKAAARARQEADTLIRGLSAQIKALAPQGAAALQERLRAAERKHATLGQASETAERWAQQVELMQRALAGNPVTEAALARVLEAQQQHLEAEQQVQDKAAHLSIGADSWLCTEKTSAELGQVRWTLVPGEGGAELDMQHQQLQQALEDELKEAGLESMQQARLAWQEGLTLSSTLQELQRALVERAPEGLESLQAAATGAQPEDAQQAQRLPELERAQIASQEQLESAQSQRDDAQRALNEARGRHTALEKAHAQSEARASQVARDVDEARLRLQAARSAQGDAALAEAWQAARSGQAQAAQARAEADAALKAHNPDLVQGEVRRAERTLQGHDEALRDHHDKIAGLEALLAKASAQGRFEELGEAQVELTQAERRYASVLRDAEAAKRLYAVVEARYAETQRRFLAPVVEQARPYLQAIRPGSQLTMTPDLGVDKLVRAGAEEAFERLSGGTREQLSVIVRLALARVLAKDGLAMPLILDDTMGWTDDGRFLQMTRILRSASKTLQLIILTCHPARFARLEPERTIDLGALRAEAASRL